MVRIFVYNNRLVRKHELVLNPVGKFSFDSFKTRVSFIVPSIFRLLGPEDINFTLGDNIVDDDVDDDDVKLYLVLDTDFNRLIESFCVILDSALSFL